MCGLLLLAACEDAGEAGPELDAGTLDAQVDAAPADAGADAAGDAVVDLPMADAGDPACRQELGGSIMGTHVLRFEGDGLRIYWSRRFVEWGSGESSIFALDRATVEHGGSCIVLSDLATLNYENTHHNWHDKAQLAVGESVWTVAVEFLGYSLSSDSRYRVQATLRDAGGTVVLGPIDMRVTGAPLDGAGLGSPSVDVSELMPVNASGLRDEQGEAEPWLELSNSSGSAEVDLSGYVLSDPSSPSRRYVFPEGARLQSHLVLFADGEPAEGDNHLPFRLEPSGSIMLTAPDGTSVGERSYQDVPADHSLVLMGGEYVLSTSPTPGAGPL